MPSGRRARLARTAPAALQQGGIQAAVNPAVQTLGIKGGVRGEFDPLGPVEAFGTGAAISGGMHGAGEVLGNVIGQAMLRRQLREMAREDPAFLGIVPHEAEPTAAQPAPAAERALEPADELAGTRWATYRTADALREHRLSPTRQPR